MTAGSDSRLAVAGGLARHIPVLGRRAIEWLAVRADGVYIDGTFGAGGHSERLLAGARRRVLAFDRDPTAIMDGAPLAAAAVGRLVLVEERFANLAEVARRLGHDAVDGVLLDLGVSSMQLDRPERGFSFRRDGPLDMRMGGSGPSAADVVAQASERDLAAIIRTLGEERHARAIAGAIVRSRAQTPIRTTGALADIVGRIVKPRPGAIDPATRTFQALRIFVNEELAELAAALAAAEHILRPGGRLVVISFHSLEDRIVKSFLVARGRRSAPSRHLPQAKAPSPTFRILTPRPVMPDEDEIAENPRARSAKLRAAERTDAPAGAGIPRDLLPQLPSLADVMSAGRRR